MTATQPLSLYIHIPFCKHKCRYCDFYSIPSDDNNISAYIEALTQEWRLIQEAYNLSDTPIKTIFCGGGTPSILNVEQWLALDRTVFKTLNLVPEYEWTIECNPDSFTTDKAVTWRQTGVNRVTFGVQSLCDRELSFLGRIHTADQALAVLHDPILQTFSSIGVDVMYGLPGQTVASFSDTLDQLLSQPVVTHCSAYELTLAERTPLYRHRSIVPFPTEDDIMTMTQLVFQKNREHGFDHYEVSNFAKPGFACKHNMAYWNLSPYIGLGPGAHSFMNGQRVANVSSLEAYSEMVKKDQLPIGFTETITPNMREQEIIFLRLRTREGVDEHWFQSQTGIPFNNEVRHKKLEEFVNRGYLEYHAPFWRCTDEGMAVVDALVRDLIP